MKVSLIYLKLSFRFDLLFHKAQMLEWFFFVFVFVVYSVIPACSNLVKKEQNNLRLIWLKNLEGIFLALHPTRIGI